MYSAISFFVIAGIVLTIYGGTVSADSPTLATNVLLKAGAICFAASYLSFVVLFFLPTRQSNSLPPCENELLVCFVFCMPLMMVQLLYAILGAFVESLRAMFSVLTGDVTVFMCMAVLEIIFTIAHITFDRIRLERRPPGVRKGVAARSADRRSGGGRIPLSTLRDRARALAFNENITME